MRYRNRLLIFFISYILAYGIAIASQFFVFNGLSAELDGLAETRLRLESELRDAELGLSRLNGDILQRLLLSGAEKGMDEEDLKARALDVYADLDGIEAVNLSKWKEIDHARSSFRAYFLLASALVSGELPAAPDTLAKLADSSDALNSGFAIMLGQVRERYEDSMDSLRRRLVLIEILSLVIAAAITTASFPLAVFLVNRLTHPIEHITAVAKRLEASDFSARVEESFSGEPGVLADAFNRMADRLQDDILSLEREVGERRRAEEAGERLREGMATILRTIPAALASLDAEGRLLEWNQAMADLIGLEAEQMRGHRVWELALWLLPASELIKAPYASKQERTGGEGSGDSLLARIPGAPEGRVYQAASFPLKAADSGGYLLRLTDISDEEAREAQLQRLQTMKTVGTLAGSLAHDFNNILGAVLGASSLMRYEIESGQNTKDLSLRHLNLMDGAVDRATGIISQLLALSRSQEFKLEPVDLLAALDQAALMANSSLDKSVRIEWGARPDAAWVMADQGQLVQILLNLLINAGHAMTLMRPVGQAWGGRLGLSVIRGENEGEREMWRLTVSDEGVGMDQATIKRIFDPFFSTKSQGKGSGLGLAMVKDTLARFHGDIQVESEPAQGSVFSATLPCVASASKEAQAEAILKRGEGLVLVVDDEEGLRDLCCEILESCGYHTRQAADGQEALDAFHAEPEAYCLALLDLSMPRLDGSQVFTEMRALRPELPLILCSGHPGDERIASMRKEGLKNILYKPYNLRRLAEAADAALCGRALEF